MPFGRRFDVDPRDELRVGAGLADQRAVLGRRDRVVLVAADDQIDLGEALDQRAVVGERQMRDRDDRSSRLPLQPRQVLAPPLRADRRMRVCGSLSRLISLVFRHRPMKPTFSAPNVRIDIRRGAADRLAGARVDDIRDDPLPFRLAHPLDQHVVAEVELVVAERGQVEAGGVQRGDHLLAFEDARRDRRRQEVAGEHEQRRAAGCRELLLQRGDAGEAADAVDRHRGVDVVDLQERERRARPRRARLFLAR